MMFGQTIAPEFFASMEKPGINGFNVELVRSSQVWKEIALLYEHNFLRPKIMQGASIPQIIHQIWLGGECPKRYDEWRQSWKELHPQWQYRLWTDADLASFDLRNSNLFNSLTNQGARSDILRYEILYKYGGIYADTDFECIHNFDDIVRKCNFFAGIPHCVKDGPLINNALIGSTPGHSVIAWCLSNVSANINEQDPNSIMELTGPLLLTGSVMKALKAGEDGILILPATFFYPFPGHLRNIRNMRQARKYIEPETYAIHFWEVSWSEESRSLTQKLKDFLPETMKEVIKNRFKKIG